MEIHILSEKQVSLCQDKPFSRTKDLLANKVSRQEVVIEVEVASEAEVVIVEDSEVLPADVLEVEPEAVSEVVTEEVSEEAAEVALKVEIVALLVASEAEAEVIDIPS